MTHHTLEFTRTLEGFGSDELKSQVLKRLRKGDVYINFAYSNYSGDFYDKAVIEYLKTLEEGKLFEEFYCEHSHYFGQNAYLTGLLAREFLESIEDYLLGFRELEPFFYELEEKSFLKTINDLIIPDIESDREIELTDEQKAIITAKILERDVLSHSADIVDYSTETIEEMVNEMLPVNNMCPIEKTLLSDSFKEDIFKIVDDCKTVIDDLIDCVQLTIGINSKGTWTFQTGDLSFMGNCYFMPFLKSVWIELDTDKEEILRAVVDELIYSDTNENN
jgi:hypothetical protein